MFGNTLFFISITPQQLRVGGCLIFDDLRVGMMLSWCLFFWLSLKCIDRLWFQNQQFWRHLADDAVKSENEPQMLKMYAKTAILAKNARKFFDFELQNVNFEGQENAYRMLIFWQFWGSDAYKNNAYKKVYCWSKFKLNFRIQN